MSQTAWFKQGHMASASGPRVPVVRTSRVYHVGTMEVAHRGRDNVHSLEGHCLSVSQHPEAWRQIAKLGNAPVWALAKPQGLLLDIFSVRQESELVASISEWGRAQGLCRYEDRWQAWTTDEDGEESYTLHTSAQLARDELDEDAEGGRITPVTILAATPAMLVRIGWKSMADMDCFELLAALWADDTIPEVDGIWWSETLDPARLSAPRGGIFPSRIGSWACTLVGEPR